MGKHQIECTTFFHEKVSEILSNTTLHQDWFDLTYKHIEGDLVREEYCAHIDIWFRPREFKKYAPIVFCDETWITKQLDWHCFKAKDPRLDCGDRYRLCWLHPKEWCLAHNNQLKTLETVITEGTLWLGNNVSKLLDRHWIGNELGLTKWRTEWDGWAHGSLGTQEFNQEREEKGHPRNWQVKN
jgi:hypothetical protein